ncbi:MAG: NAD+ synthase [Anaerolineales bacterium]|nr:MAG: NAD+ synthase [Anaerolineales bacterium]
MQNEELSLMIDTGMVRKTLVDFIRNELARAGFSRAVVGVSGGVDSALTCFLSAEALGPENVLAIFMPYETTGADSRDHAALVIEATGAREQTVDITPMATPVFDRFPDASKIRRGNVMARMRMIVLYDQSAAFNGLVIGTGNKTESLLGYTTLYGDSACAINPLGDLYKTQILQLARAVGVPEPIVSKPPSADLWDGQTDEDELGFTYDEVDRLLLLLIDQGCSAQACVDAGFDEKFVQKTGDRMRRNQFKRVQPPVARLAIGPRPGSL